MANIDDHDQVVTITLDPVLDLKAASPLAENLLAHRGSDLIVDAGQVERLGGQSLQVLLSACVTWQADGRTVEFAATSPAFIDGLSLLGFDTRQVLNPRAMT